MAKQLIGALVVVVALLLAYIFLTEGEPAKRPGFTWNLPEITNFDRIEIVRGEETLVVDRGSGGWRIQQPLAFAADEDQMEQVAGLFADQETRLVVDGEEPADSTNLSRFGLDTEPLIQVRLFDSGQPVVRFGLGSTEQTQSGASRTWIRPEGADRIYRVNRNLPTVLDKNLSEWRNTDILVLTQEQQDALTAVNIQYGTGRIRLEKQGQQWQMVEPVDAQTDANLISRYINQVDTLRATDFADEVDAAQAGLDPPMYVLTLELGEQERFELRFGGEFTRSPSQEEGGESVPVTPEQRRYVQLNDGPIYQVTERTVDQFLWTTGDFRPRDVISLERDQVVRIVTVDRDGTRMELVRNDPPEEGGESSWRMVEPEAIDPVDAAEMRRLLTNVADVDATRFAEGVTVEQAGLHSPRRQITMTLADGAEHVIAIGSPTQPTTESGSARNMDHYVQVDGGEIFELRAYKVNNLVKSPEEFRPDQATE
ncbi:MAG: DUF4340 domain-containing protein [Bradymonadales bacterium]|nr:DUF4340 domain-containing protein [Bradymonadales bacterium]